MQFKDYNVHNELVMSALKELSKLKYISSLLKTLLEKEKLFMIEIKRREI